MAIHRRDLRLQTISFTEASDYVRDLHREHEPPPCWKFGVCVTDETRIRGVVMVNRPVSRILDDGWTLEATRCCTDSTPHVASKLYAAVWRAARALGYRRMVTYTRSDEHGISLKAAGWTREAFVKGRSWTTPTRPRATQNIADRYRWTIGRVDTAPTLIRYQRPVDDRQTNLFEAEI